MISLVVIEDIARKCQSWWLSAPTFTGDVRPEQVTYDDPEAARKDCKDRLETALLNKAWGGTLQWEANRM